MASSLANLILFALNLHLTVLPNFTNANDAVLDLTHCLQASRDTFICDFVFYALTDVSFLNDYNLVNILTTKDKFPNDGDDKEEEEDSDAPGDLMKNVFMTPLPTPMFQIPDELGCIAPTRVWLKKLSLGFSIHSQLLQSSLLTECLFLLLWIRLTGAAISRNVQYVLFENFAQAVLSETGQEGYQSETVEALYKKEEKMTMMMISRMLMTAMLLLFPLNIVKHQQLPIA